VRDPDGGGTGVASEDGRAREPRGPSSSPFQRALTFGPTFNFGPAGTLLLLLVGAPSRIGYSVRYHRQSYISLGQLRFYPCFELQLRFYPYFF